PRGVRTPARASGARPTAACTRGSRAGGPTRRSGWSRSRGTRSPRRARPGARRPAASPRDPRGRPRCPRAPPGRVREARRRVRLRPSTSVLAAQREGLEALRVLDTGARPSLLREAPDHVLPLGERTELRLVASERADLEI